MRTIFFAIVAIAMIFTACNRKSLSENLQTSRVNFDPRTILTGGNGNGTNPTEYTRYYEIHERNGTVDCITTGGDCKVKASMTKPTTNQINEFELLSQAIASGTVPSYFQGSSWTNLFPELANNPDIIDQLKSGNLFMSKAPSVANSYCYVLSTTPNYESTNVLKVWYWTFSQTALTQVIGGVGPVYDRVDEWSDDGTKCICVNKGQTCSAGIALGSQQAAQFALIDNYIQTGNIKGYFNKESWTILFPNLNDAWLEDILNGNLKIIRVEDENSVNYALTDVSTTTLSNSNTIYVWLFQK